MKHKFSIGLIFFLAFLLTIEVLNKPKKSSKKSKTKEKSKGSSNQSTYSLPMNFKINQDSYVAASILKTLGVKKHNLESLIVKFQRNCKGLKVVKSINASIKKIRELTQSRKSDRKGFIFAKRQLKIMLQNKRNTKNKYIFLGKRKAGLQSGRNNHGGRNFFNSNSIQNSRDSFRSRVGKAKTSGKGKATKKKRGKLSKLKKLCSDSGFYNAAVSKLKGTKQKLKQLKKNKLIGIIKRTLRRVLSRILGCDFVRNGNLSNTIRKAIKKITKKNIEVNVFVLAKMLKQISKNYKRKPKTLRRSRKIMRKVFTKLVRGKKITPITMMLVIKMAKNNCHAAKACYNHNIFSHKCFEVSKMCLNMKSVVKKITANKVGLVVSKLIKRFIS